MRNHVLEAKETNGHHIPNVAAAESSLGGPTMSNNVLEATETNNNDAGTSNTSSDEEDNTSSDAEDNTPSRPMDPQLLKAAMSGDCGSLCIMASQDPDVLLSRTPVGNTCIHIACAHGHQEFCNHVLSSLNLSLLTAVNADKETPLITAVKQGHASLALVLLTFCRSHQHLSDAVLQKDKNGCNALHYAIRGGHEVLALELIDTEPALTRDVNKKKESPMFIAAVKNLPDAIGKLLEISDSAHGGPRGQNVLHAAVKNGNLDVVTRIMETRPRLAREENESKFSPMSKAVDDGKIDTVTVLLEHDRSLGYLISSTSIPLLHNAAKRGHVGVAREILKHCPDAPYCDEDGWTCLHVAVRYGNTEFVQYVLASKQLLPLVNMQDDEGKTTLHLAAEKRNSRIISALLLHPGIDITLRDNNGQTARQVLAPATEDNKDAIWIPDSTASTVSPSPGAVVMDRFLLQAATSGDTSSMVQLATQDLGVLLGTTQQGNTCLHIASAHGHQEFCERILQLNPSLPNVVNADNETPLVIAVRSGHASLASSLLTFCHDHQQLPSAVLQKDKNGCNVLHHAIRRGHRDLALHLIATEPALSRDVNNNEESPMFIAMVRNFTDVVGKLLEISGSATRGPSGQNTLHAAVRNGNPDIITRIMGTCPWLAREENENKFSPMSKAVHEGKTDIVTALLEHDPSLGYLISSTSLPLLHNAARAGHVGIAREILKHCPDAPYCDDDGRTCLHIAVLYGCTGFVRFVLESKQLRPLVNMQDHKGRTALHVAAEKPISKIIISALLLHPGIDITLPNNSGQTVRQVLASASEDDNKQRIWIPDGEANLSRSPGALVMDRRLLEAATSGDSSSIMQLAQQPAMLLATTLQGNTCLHIASAHGHQGACERILEQNQSLIETVNADGETPFLTAVTSGRVSLASFFLRYCLSHHLNKIIFKKDKHGCNVLHHAIRSGHIELAIKLITAEPALSKAVNKYDESPMFIAVMRDFANVFEKLLEVPDSAHCGTFGFNALHAAIRNGNQGIAERLVRARPELAREQDNSKMTPMRFAAIENKVGVLRVLLQYDFSLGFEVSTDGRTLLEAAASRGHVDVAREILRHCPDAPYSDNTDGMTCLHEAVSSGHTEFVKFVVQSTQLRKLINMRDNDGDTALHYAIRKCNPDIVAVLLHHQDRDVTLLNNGGNPAAWVPSGAVEHAKTLNWNKLCSLMLKADPKNEGEIYNLYKVVKAKVTKNSRSDIRSLTQTYTSNTSLVAILIATITFAAAFTLPGGYSNDPGSEGLPVMARKLAFQAFLISNTLAMCSSLSIAFICIIARWEDLEFLVYYRSFTKKVMWFAYMATTTAFATGLYTVLAPRLPGLAIAICVASILLPIILTKLVGEWPIHKLKFQMGSTFKPEIIDIV